MKKTFIFLISLVFINLANAQKWYWQNPKPQGNFLRSVDFVDSNTGIAIGALGTILKTTNGGNNWIVKNSDVTNQLNSISFFNLTNGIVVGNVGTILKTTNSGDSWALQTKITNKPLTNVFLINENKHSLAQNPKKLQKNKTKKFRASNNDSNDTNIIYLLQISLPFHES